jgi:hypothetical protein
MKKKKYHISLPVLFPCLHVSYTGSSHIISCILSCIFYLALSVEPVDKYEWVYETQILHNSFFDPGLTKLFMRALIYV